MSFAALVLAGSRPGGDPLSDYEGVSHKGLIQLEGQSLLERVVTALKAAGAREIGVSCDDRAVAAEARRLGALVLAPEQGPSASALKGFEALGVPMLLTTVDHALLKPEWVRRMIEQTPDDVDLSVMLARRDRIEQVMPGSRRTYLSFADGKWSGCNLFYFQSNCARAALDIWGEIEADRKHPWRIARKLGIRTLFAYAMGRLTLAEGIARLGNRIGIKAALIEAEDGLAAVDVDKPQDLADIKALLNRHNARQAG